jgi:hypothetical protein
MTNAEVLTRLIQANIPVFGASFQFMDLNYETCSAEFVLANWQAWLNARPLELCVTHDTAGKTIRDRPLWLKDSGDCDNFALGTMVWADMGNALRSMRESVARGGLAYGVLSYQAGPARLENNLIAGAHAINWFIDHDQQVRFFDAGFGTFVDLTLQERSTVWFGLAA